MFDCIVASATHFACENHDEPGECTEECLELAELIMWSGYEGQAFDPTGCSYYPEPPQPEHTLRNGGVFVTYFKEPMQ